MANYNLFDAASLAMIPVGSKEGTVYSIKPEPVYGSEEVTNGDFATDSDWNKGSSTTISNGEASFNGALSYVYQDILTIGKKYDCSINVNNWTSGAAFSVGSNATGSGTIYSNITRVSNTETTFTFIAVSTILGIGSRSFNINGSIDNVSVKEVLTSSGDFDFTRATSANRINSDNLIESVGNNVPRMDYTDGSCPSLLLEPQSTNLINYPVSFTNSYWTKSGARIEGDPSTAGAEKVVNGDFASNINDWAAKDSTIIWDNGKLKCDNSSGNGAGGPRQNVGLQNNKTYIFTVTIQLISATANGTFGIMTSTAGGTGQSDIYYGSTLVAGGDAITETGQFTTGTDGDVSIQFWVDRPNAVFTIDNVSVKEVQGFSAPSVDNPTSAFKLVVQNNGYLLSAYTLNLSIGNSVAISCCVKDSVQRLSFGGATLAGTDVYSSKILSNGWYRQTVVRTFTSASASASIQFIFYNTTGSELSYDIFGAQLEQQSYPTSFIYNGTEGGIVTRVAETCGGAGDSTVFNSTEGVLYAEISALANDGTYRILSISDGTRNERVYMQYTSTTNEISVVVKTGNITQANMQHTLSDETQNAKVAVRYKANDFAFYINGTQIGTDTSGTTPVGLNNFSFDQGNGTTNFYGNVKQVITFNTALLDSELAALTTL